MFDILRIKDAFNKHHFSLYRQEDSIDLIPPLDSSILLTNSCPAGPRPWFVFFVFFLNVFFSAVFEWIRFDRRRPGRRPSPPPPTHTSPSEVLFSDTFDTTQHYWPDILTWRGPWLLRGIWPQHIEHPVESGRESMRREKKKKIQLDRFVFWTKQYKENITVGQSVSQSVSVWVPTTGGASSPAIMCKSRQGADTLTSISVLWWHAVNENMGRYTGCSEKQHIPPRWRIEADTEMSHTYHPHHTQIHTHMHTHTPTTTTNPIMLSPSPIPLRNERGLCQSNSIVWVEVMNSSLLSIHLRLIVFLFVPVICRW